jgi:dihydrolipoamide dehydrogenase
LQITGIRGHGTISAPGQVSVKKEDGSSEILTAKNILLAVGSEVTPFPGINVRRFDLMDINDLNFSAID